MHILVIGLVAVIGLFVLSRFIGRGQERLLLHYEVFEKRFGFKLQTHKSRWGSGINEHFSLSGNFRGYPVSLYSHYRKVNGKKVEWTSLAMETLFAEELAFDIEFTGSTERAKFGAMPEAQALPCGPGISFLINRDGSESLLSAPVRDRFDRFVGKDACGVVRLKNGFLEYRELGLMETEDVRVRFQEALLMLADLADAVSIFVVESKRKG